MKPVKLAWIIYLIVLICIYFIGYGIAHAAYDSFKVQCETLQGKGYVMLFIADDTYKVPVVCQWILTKVLNY